MSLNVAIQMDPIERIRIAGDTGFALMLEAQARGHSLYTYTPDKLSMRDGKVTAPMRPVKVRDVDGDYFTAGAELHEGLARGTFPPPLREEFWRVLDHFGQSPVIVRSSWYCTRSRSVCRFCASRISGAA